MTYRTGVPSPTPPRQLAVSYPATHVALRVCIIVALVATPVFFAGMMAHSVRVECGREGLQTRCAVSSWSGPRHSVTTLPFVPSARVMTFRGSKGGLQASVTLSGVELPHGGVNQSVAEPQAMAAALAAFEADPSRRALSTGYDNLGLWSWLIGLLWAIALGMAWLGSGRTRLVFDGESNRLFVSHGRWLARTARSDHDLEGARRARVKGSGRLRHLELETAREPIVLPAGAQFPLDTINAFLAAQLGAATPHPGR